MEENKRPFLIVSLLLALFMFALPCVVRAESGLEQLREELAKVNSVISRYEEHVGLLRRDSSESLSIQGNFSGNIRLTHTGGKGIPYVWIYSDLYFKHKSSDLRLFLQNGLGTPDWDSFVFYPPAAICSLFWGKQNFNLQLGEFSITESPFLIKRAVQQKDLNYVPRYHTFTGASIRSNFPNLGWHSFLAQVANGDGSESYDRYAFFNKFDTQIAGLNTGLTLFRVFDDISSAVKQTQAYSSTALGISFNNQTTAWYKKLALNGELIFKWTKQNIFTGLKPAQEYALQLGGNFNFLAPIRFNFYTISPDYPLAYTAIRELTPDFIYEKNLDPEEEWLDNYFANIRHLEITAGDISLANLGKLTLMWDRSQELTAEAAALKSFGHRGVTFKRYLPPTLYLLGNAPFELTLEEYWTRREGTVLSPINYRQGIQEVSLQQLFGEDTLVRIGYQRFHFNGIKEGKSEDRTVHKPFVEIKPVLWGVPVTWRREFIWELAGAEVIPESYHKLSINKVMGKLSLDLTYEATKAQNGKSENEVLLKYSYDF